MNVKLISITKPFIPELKTAEDLIVYTARVSNPKNQLNIETAPKLINYLIKNKHWSPFEMVDMTVEIQTSRAISHQIVRHKSFNFQEFCIAGDSMITTDTVSGRSKKVAIKDLYKRYMNKQYREMSDNLIRVYDEHTKTLCKAKIKEIFKTGIKEVYELTLDNHKKIKATNEHKFLTFDGFKRLKDITENDYIATNGVPLYQNYEWLKNAKLAAVANKSGVQGIADLAGISYHTIRKWLKIHKLTFTKKETAEMWGVWNKGLPKEKQPRFRKTVSEETRLKMHKSAKHGQDCCLYKNGNTKIKVNSHRHGIARYSKARHLELLIKQNFLCPIANIPIDKNNSEVDHILPVAFRPDLAFNIDNLQALSIDAHKLKSHNEMLASNYTIAYHKVKSIVFVGNEETYDIEVEHHSHNYIANGIVTHNSQRYSTIVDYENFEIRKQAETNRQSSFDNFETDITVENAINNVIDDCFYLYEKLLNMGVARETARFILPECTQTTLYMKGNVRSWIHYLQLRTSEHTQKEHRLIALEILKIFKKEFPNIAIDLFSD